MKEVRLVASPIREEQFFYWTQEILVPVEIYTVRRPMMGLEFAKPRYKPSALAIELNSSKAIAGKELSLSSWCIASLCIYHFSIVVDFSSEKYSVLVLVHCTRSTEVQELLVPVEKFTVRMPMMGLELATPRISKQFS